MANWKAGFLILISALLALPADAAAPGKKPPEPKSVKNVGWELHGARVVNPGQAQDTGSGVLITGYQVAAIAVPRGDHALFAGTFAATLSLFKPSRNLPGQTAGKWYVAGNWTITHSGGGPKQRTWENPMMARGSMTAELSFDPRTARGTVDALLQIPRLSAAGWRAPVRGVFSGNEKFEGTLSFALRSWK